MVLTLKEWRSLPEDERGKRYKELSKHDMFLERVGGTDAEPNEEYKKEVDKWLNEVRKKHGISC